MNEKRQDTEGVRAYPILKGFARLGIGTTFGYEIVNSGELQTYLIGRRRFVTEAALQEFIQKRVAQSLSQKNERLAA